MDPRSKVKQGKGYIEFFLYYTHIFSTHKVQIEKFREIYNFFNLYKKVYGKVLSELWLGRDGNLETERNFLILIIL